MIRSLLTHLTSEKALTAACVVALCSPLVGEGVHYAGLNPFEDRASSVAAGLSSSTEPKVSALRVSIPLAGEQS